MFDTNNEQSLEAFISQRLALDVTSDSFRRVFASTVRYLASGYKSIAEYHRDLQREVDFSQFEFTAADFRIEVSSVCNFILKMRFYALALCLERDPRDVIYEYGRYGLCRRDAILAWNLCLKDKDSRKQIRLCAKTKHKGLCRDMVTHQELHHRLGQTSILFAELHRNAERQVRKNMRWVATAHNIPLQDLTCDIMCKVLTSYYQCLPNNFTLGHQLNYLRATLTNRINNMNNYYGAEKRRRMQKVGEDKYEIVVMSDNQLQKAFGSDEDTVSYESMLGEDARVHTEQMENSLTINKLLDEAEGTKRHKLYATVLGRDCADFTDYLREHGMLKETMSCASEWLMVKPSTFIRKTLARWLDVNVSSVNTGLETLRNALQAA
ncbi:hypothetical protein YOLOSWAG_332 [Erwinia phage vB_EamM_Yoloswag]|uniref:Uncharacterized protein n=1 Tax=Erwinia phage vB_EamM_Yoloswag TaxID=1958956 RepID=A0A1S6L3P5_9CAUD|nr:hypothetical protein HOR66_gp332 [Erwinia phage vB_EamM_Yoloswag]AQT28800.1 hypothetical protein YOLOSWAG_332 [Erwinia phage vB_EamM_Yoloswag]